MSSFKYRAVHYRRKKCEEHPVRRLLGMALRDARVAVSRKGRDRAGCVLILRADTEGINAGKFFTHQIIR